MAPFIAELQHGQAASMQNETPSTKEHFVSSLSTTNTLPTSISSTTQPPTWQSIAAHRRYQITSSIPSEWLLSPHLLQSKRPVDLVKTCGLLSEREIGIVYSTAVDLLEKIRAREYTAVEVTTAFCMASAVAQQGTNCLAWTMYPSALSLAAELDAHMEKTGKPIGPLHGLPISVKEHIYLQNTPSTSGFVAWADNFCTDAAQEGICIKVLREQGAIFHVKTTNPQSLLSLETDSNLYGATTNPLNTTLSPGGSSGGESALIAMHGSILGIGTDIGGSVRVPALNCGLYALKPSVARLPHSGLNGAHEGMESIVGVVGPIATCVADVELFCRTLLDAEPWIREVGLLPIPWGVRESLSLSTSVSYGNDNGNGSDRKLRIGMIYTDGVHHPHPPITRILHQTTLKLQNAGHEIVPFPTHLHRQLIPIIDALYLLDGGTEYTNILSQTSEPATPLLSWLLHKESTQDRTIAQQWTLHRERNRLQDAYATLMREVGVDCLVGPGGVSVASKRGEARYWGWGGGGGDYWGGADAGEGEGEGEVRRTEMEGLWRDDEGKGDEEDSGPRKYEGGSVGLQIVGRRLQEEKLLDMVKIIEGVLKG
ncbi:hypothetical protein SBOR_8985 [Sclerotinia borealis F-4128]|uniref:amidase n=1 Tax=Sclerotinia borealis (strain F-4128) TaxID=1432307 RepID=W9C1E7_SCLBF|nr:hypothetical protein SBOR_8985 [Sclerotinia borealis F-4128]